MKPNISEIAKRAGVSTATVSRALNNKNVVHETTRKRIFEIAQDLDYKRSNSLIGVNPASKAIALILPETVDEFYSSIAGNIEKLAIQKGYHLFSAASRSQRVFLEDLIEMLTYMRVEGIILMAPVLHNLLAEIVPQCRLPVVAINTGKTNIVPTFNIGNYQGAYAMTEHLISHKYQNIATIRGTYGNYDAEERFRGYCDALKAHNLPVKNEFIASGDFTDKCGFYAFSRLMSLREKPDAIFAANDMMAIGAYKAAEHLNVKIPQDVAIAGFDDIHIGTIISPQLTTVHVPTNELGAEAFHYLLEMIERKNSNEEEKGSELFYTELAAGVILRESCGCKINHNF